MPLRSKRYALYVCCLAATACVVACDRDSVAAQPGKTAAARTGYELVTTTHPVSPDKYFASVHYAYKVCASTASMMNLPVRPFPGFPADMEIQRTVYMSDGKSFYRKDTATFPDLDVMQPENGCPLTFQQKPSTSILHHGRLYDTDAAPGEEALAPTGIVPMQMPDDALSGYTVRRKVRGVVLKCAPPGSPEINKVMSESCIVDPEAGKLADTSGQPLTAYLRVTPSIEQGEVVTEPVSLKLGIAIPPAVFEPPKAK
jgi:hypothetical protein